MAVNVSAKQLHEVDFAQRVVAALDETRLSPRWLNLELTESALMDTYEKAPATLERLDTLGIRTSIDDFGTGYSSLNYLRRFNFQTLKMDRCFVSEIATNQKAAVIVKGLISIAHNLGISVIAEGVERHDQLRLLAAENCDHVQGFLTGRPVAPEQMLKLLRSVNVKKQNARVTGGVQTLLDDCSDAIPAEQLDAMAEACRNRIEPGVESNDDSLIILAGR
jgi:EAL domain-containing protein (putative c-di-GMP-specific phosphodiesterase class I)